MGKESLVSVGNDRDTVANCTVHLRSGSIIAEIRGPTAAVSKIRLSALSEVSVDGVRVSTVGIPAAHALQSEDLWTSWGMTGEWAILLLVVSLLAALCLFTFVHGMFMWCCSSRKPSK